ncbi:MAG: hypothetical protein QOE97_1831 [Pseudonocardiales bacterium]|jgi:uncharacterized protein (DUF1330 family)|nr:hypothetical protein [Pseudonocardiales bacterium]
MVAYVIAESEHLDTEDVRRYRKLAAASIERHGGRYLARGVTPSVREGEWAAKNRMVIIEFASIDEAHAWYDSDEYQAALASRSTPPRRRMLFVDGVATTS